MITSALSAIRHFQNVQKDYVKCRENNDVQRLRGHEIYENQQIPALVDLFNRLKSDDPQIVKTAEGQIKELEGQQISFHYLALHSFPLWPIDALALKQIALDEADSGHPLVRERALIACGYLFLHGYSEGREAAAILSAKKMRNEDETVQQDGFKYFSLLLGKWRPTLPPEDLVLAISIAEKICESDRWCDASSFFRTLVERGQKADVALLRETALNLCASENSHAYYIGDEICEKIIEKRSKEQDLVRISLEAIISMCGSKEGYRRGKAFSLFWSLLERCPELAIEPLLNALEEESKRKNPQIAALMRVDQLVRHQVSGLTSRSDDPQLLRILTNLSNCDSPYIQKEAEKLKQIVESRNA
ncbi:MAG: hypothetical protein JSS61_04835 [Verrucomicrobia bacterium]|nr:hypothetical protein [Verrucomicrobiota bacterium]